MGTTQYIHKMTGSQKITYANARAEISLPIVQNHILGTSD